MLPLKCRYSEEEKICQSHLWHLWNGKNWDTFMEWKLNSAIFCQAQKSGQVLWLSWKARYKIRQMWIS